MMNDWKQENGVETLVVETVTSRAKVFAPNHIKWWRWTVESGCGDVYATGSAASKDEAKEMARRQLELMT